jgi:beta-glucosidase
MKKILVLFTAALLAVPCVLRAQEFTYPFQNPALSEDERLDNAVSLMTVDEKISTIVGQGVPRLGIANPGSTEAIHGIVRGGSNQLPNMGFAGQFQQQANRQQGNRQQAPQTPPPPRMVNSTAFPQAYGIGETWDREMAFVVGDVMSYEARYYSQKSGRNCLILWAPNADLARDPRWGRTEESFGEDPYLVGEMVAAEVKGIQGDDPTYWRGAALMKHFLANSNEDNRYGTDSQFDESLFRDYYSYGFWKGAKAGSQSVMTAYNRYNGIPCEANPFIKDILNKEWGMNGTIVNDAGALRFMVSAHNYAKDINEAIGMSLEAGLTRFIDSNFQQVKTAYEAGFISDELLNERTKGNLRTMLKLGMMDAACPYDEMQFGETAPWETQEFKDKARLVTQKSVVLLKNEGGILPIDKNKVKKIAVFGNRAEEVLKDWYGALPSYTVSALDGIKAKVEGTDVEVRFQRWDSDGSAQELAKWADICIVCVGNHPATSPDWGAQSIQAPWAMGTVAGDGREALDRRSLKLETEDLIKVIWQVNHNTVVALISSFPFAINWTAENVPGIVHLTQCSQELGNGLADVLFGDYNPAGRTNQTWVSDILDLPNLLDYDIRHGRTYMYAKAKPIFPFGYGLSYTSFKYSSLKVRKDGDNYIFRFKLQNTGKRDGEEVVQLYATFKGDDAAKRLRGFERIAVKAGETKAVEICVPADDLKLWDEGAHAFAFKGSRAKVQIGASSADIRLKKNVKF